MSREYVVGNALVRKFGNECGACVKAVEHPVTLSVAPPSVHKSPVLDQKFAVLLSEDVIGDCGKAELIAETQTKLKHQCGFPTSDRPADANRS